MTAYCLIVAFFLKKLLKIYCTKQVIQLPCQLFSELEKIVDHVLSSVKDFCL